MFRSVAGFTGNESGGGVPTSSQNYITVIGTGTPVENGELLKTAMEDVRLLTPNGNPISQTNRATVILYPGEYDLDGDFISFTAYIDMIGIGNREDIIITSGNSTQVIYMEDSDFVDSILEKFSIVNTSTGYCIGYFASGYDAGKWNDLYLESSGSYVTTPGNSWDGIYTKIKCNSNGAFNGNIGVDCIISDCTFRDNSVGWSNGDYDVTISGKILNCTSQTACFGSINTTGVIRNLTFASTSKIINCSGFSRCFGYNNGGNITLSGYIFLCFATTTSFGHVRISGTLTVDNTCIIDTCKGSQGSNFLTSFSTTGTTINFSGRISNCEAGRKDLAAQANINFLSSATSTLSTINILAGSIIENCISNGHSSFGFGNTVTMSGGTIDTCKATSASFLTASIVTTCTILMSGGKIINCTATTGSFVNALGGSETNSGGEINNCTGTTTCFGNTSSTGKLIQCTRTGGYGTHAGSIIQCTFSENHATTATLTLAAGAKVVRSSIYQAGAGNTIGGAGNVTVIHTATNKALAGVVNLIASPNNVVDAAFTV